MSFCVKTICLIVCAISSIAKDQTYNLTGSSLYGIKGGDFSFTCHVPDDARIKFLVLFRKDGNDYCSVDPDDCRGSSFKGSRYRCGCNNKRLYYMNISSLTSSDEGNWDCIDADTRVKSNTVSLPVYYGPDNIIFSPQPVEVVENSSREIDCQSDCNPTCSITWYKGSDTTGTIVPSTNGHLKLSKIKREDTTYTCQAQHTVLPSRTKTMQITVFYGPDNINIKPPRTTVAENSTINITCSSDCNPSCTVNWYKDSTLILSDNRVLSLPNIKRQQDGNYTCHVTNSQIPESTKSKVVPITVNYPPIINSIKPDSTNNTIDEGSRVAFSCSVDSRPSSTVTWSRSEEGQPSSTEQYILPNATCQHTDNYTCTASNDIGKSISRTTPLYVRCSPRENSPTNTRIVNKINSTVTLKLDIIAYPKPSFYWVFNKTRLTVTSTDEDISLNNFKSKLQLKLNESMFGDYIVTVSNNVGNTNFTFTVVNGDPPIHRKMENQTGVIIGSTVAGVLVIVAVIAVVAGIFLRRKGKQKEGDSIPMKSGNGGQASDNTFIVNENTAYVGGDELFQPNKAKEQEVLENTLYEGSDHIFGARGTGSGIFSQGASSDFTTLYATVDKSKQKGKKKGRALLKKGKSDKKTEEIYANSDVTTKKKKAVIDNEGLIYADVDFSDIKATKKPVVRKEEEVEYVQIQPGVRGPTPPPIVDSEGEENDGKKKKV